MNLIDIDFFNACKNKNDKIIKELIHNPLLNVNYIGEYNNTALIWLCRNGMTNQAIELIDMFGVKCLPGHVNIYNMTALYYACNYIEEDISLKLLNIFGNDCNVNIIDNINNISAFCLACYNKHIQTINILFDIINDDSINVIDKKTGNTPLLFLCYNNMNEEAMKLIDKFSVKCLPNQYNNYGYSALYYCCTNNIEDSAMKLLEIYTNKDDIEALNESIKNKISSVTYQLTILMEDIEEKNPLIKAIVYKNEDLVIELINAIDTNIDQITNNGFTLLMFACIAQLPNICLLLLDRGVDSNKINKYNKTALDYCSTSNNINMSEIILLLLKKENCMRDNEYEFRQYNVDEFDIDNKIYFNKGGYGKVFKATIIKDNKNIVLKQSLRYNNTRLINDDISKELLLIKRINETNINAVVILYGFCITERHFYLVLEPLKRKLDEYFNIIKILDNQTRNELFRIAFNELLENVKDIHSLGIIHNDIKMENIMVNCNKIILIDFGISEFIGFAPKKSTIDNYLTTDTIKAPDNLNKGEYLIDNNVVLYNSNRKTFSSDTYSIAVTMLQGIFNSKYKYIVFENKIYNNSNDDYDYDYDDDDFVLTDKNIIDSYSDKLYYLLCSMLDNNSSIRLSIKDVLSNIYFNIISNNTDISFDITTINNNITTYSYNNSGNNYSKISIINDYIHYNSYEIKNQLMELKYKDDIYDNYKHCIITGKYKLKYNDEIRLEYDLNSIINAIICMKNNNFDIKTLNDHYCYYYLLIRFYSSIFNHVTNDMSVIIKYTSKTKNEILDTYLEIYNKIKFTYIPIVIYIEYKVIELQKMNIRIEIIKQIEVDMVQNLYTFIVAYEDINITISDLIDVLFKYSAEKVNIMIEIGINNGLYSKVLSFL